MPEEKKPEPSPVAARANDPKPEAQPYQTAAEAVGLEGAQGVPDPRLSQSPGLQKIVGSEAPSLASGAMVNHVMGPGQNPVDPIAAGLDVNYSPKLREQMRAPTQTGILGAGNRPSTYAEKTDGAQVPQASQPTGETAKPVDASEIKTEPSQSGDVPVLVDAKPLIEKEG